MLHAEYLHYVLHLLAKAKEDCAVVVSLLIGDIGKTSMCCLDMR